ncbi:sigma-70 family RNA polymerase sigma factor [Nocardioides sp. SYSU DS0651]|uniref:sigma-70 family RNA polymerase sigma factor n=1 Tax=Nocardioides sp. SYSU DS0651 TaxID=3415955 RepID=UPI003F4C742A
MLPAALDATDPADEAVEPDEAVLLARARAGDRTAVAALYARHREAALRLAQLLAGPDGAEDLLADAFARIVARFAAGGGPTSSFHGYLFTTIRNRHRDLQRRGGREEPVSDQPWLLDGAVAPVEPSLDGLDGPGGTGQLGELDAVAVAALATLPAPWQRVLRLLEVEELGIAEVAARTALSPAAVSSLAYRAREGLRTAYLDHRVGQHPAASSECAWVRQRLSRYVRAGLGARGTARTAAHLTGCSGCGRLVAELEQVNRLFRFPRVTHRPAYDGHPAAERPRPARDASAASAAS